MKLTKDEKIAFQTLKRICEHVLNDNKEECCDTPILLYSEYFRLQKYIPIDWSKMINASRIKRDGLKFIRGKEGPIFHKTPRHHKDPRTHFHFPFQFKNFDENGETASIGK
jgi:hypothetical protein